MQIVLGVGIRVIPLRDDAVPERIAQHHEIKGRIGAHIGQARLARLRQAALALAAQPCIVFTDGIGHAQALQACVAQHALTAGLNDTFLLSLIGCIVCTVLALFLIGVVAVLTVVFSRFLQPQQVAAE